MGMSKLGVLVRLKTTKVYFMATRSVIWVILMTERSVRRCQGWRIQQGRGFDGDSGAYLANFESGVDRGSAIGLDDGGRDSLRFETVVGEGERVGADGEVYKIVAADAGGFLSAGELGAIGDDGDSGVGKNATGGVRDRASDAAESLLRECIEREEERQATTETR